MWGVGTKVEGQVFRILCLGRWKFLVEGFTFAATPEDCENTDCLPSETWLKSGIWG